MAAFALLSWLLLAGVALELPPPGESRETRGSVEVGAPWEEELERTPGAPPAWLLVELRGDEPIADLDLAVRGSEGSWASRSHLGHERLLVRPSDGKLRLRVEAAGLEEPRPLGAGLALDDPTRRGDSPRRGEPQQAFRLRLSSLRPAASLAPGSRVLGRLEPQAPLRLHPLHPGPGGLLCLEVLRRSKAGDLDLYVFDALGPRAIGELRPEREAATLEVAPAEALWILVRGRGAVDYALGATRAPEPARSPVGRFLRELSRSSTPDQRRVMAALQRNPDFLRIDAYLHGYPEGSPLALQVRPGLEAHGVERFGTFSQSTLTINPTIAGHRENAQELVDTLIHELVHALLAFPRGPGFPLANDVLDASHDPRLSEFPRLPLQQGRVPPDVARYLDANYGPSASNPQEDYTDINAGAQRLVMKVVRDNLARTGIGAETLVFENARRRAGAAAK